MKIVTWNINGLTAAKNRLSLDDMYLKAGDPDIICLQETRCSDHEATESMLRDTFEHLGFHHFEIETTQPPSTKKGYAGVAVISKIKPSKSKNAYLGGRQFVGEGRVLILDFDKFVLINAYVPNSGSDLSRLGDRLKWDEDLRHLIRELGTQPIILCGDLNVAENDIDVFAPHRLSRSAGFTPEERASFRETKQLLGIDCYRELHPDVEGYTYFSPITRARSKNNGWRIDYFLLSSQSSIKNKNCTILSSVYGSDHVPVLLEFVILEPTNEDGRLCLLAKQIYEIDKGSRFGARAYERVRLDLERFEGSIGDFLKTDPPGVGKKIAHTLQTCRANIDREVEMVSRLMQIPFIGIIGALNIVRKRDDVKMQPRQLACLRHIDDLVQKIPRAEMIDHDAYLKSVFKKDKRVQKVEILGSFVRGNLESSDIDVMIVPKFDGPEPFSAIDALNILLTDKYVIEVLSSGEQRFLGISRLMNMKSRRIDVFVCRSLESVPFMSLYLTGPTQFTRFMRQTARSNGFSLSEHGLLGFPKKLKNERDIFKALGIKYLKPEDRS